MRCKPPSAPFLLSAISQMFSAQKKVALAALVLAAQIASLTLDVHARD